MECITYCCTHLFRLIFIAVVVPLALFSSLQLRSTSSMTSNLHTVTMQNISNCKQIVSVFNLWRLRIGLARVDCQGERLKKTNTELAPPWRWYDLHALKYSYLRDPLNFYVVILISPYITPWFLCSSGQSV
jgi:hypothetical protein